MARIRTIKPEFWTSEQVVDCSPTSRLLFVGLWTFADDGGVHPYSIKRIKMEVFPGDDFTDAQVSALLDELIRVKLIRVFEADGERFLLITGWKHQKIEKPTLRWPQPTAATEFDDSSPTGRRMVDDASTPEWKGRESIGDESPEETPCSPPRGTRDGKGKRFTPPTLDQVAAYCRERNNGIDPQEFLDHYETNGWKRGNTPIKDWRACVRTWEAKRRKEQPAEPVSRVVTPQEYDRLRETGELDAIIANGRAGR